MTKALEEKTGLSQNKSKRCYAPFFFMKAVLKLMHDMKIFLTKAVGSDY